MGAPNPLFVSWFTHDEWEDGGYPNIAELKEAALKYFAGHVYDEIFIRSEDMTPRDGVIVVGSTCPQLPCVHLVMSLEADDPRSDFLSILKEASAYGVEEKELILVPDLDGTLLFFYFEENIQMFFQKKARGVLGH